jgi:DNA (cytosine-5)-methyltransferase 1
MLTNSSMKEPIPVVDLFAGPGGLGEGFSSLSEGRGTRVRYPFRIALSVEKEAFARTTLRLRAFYRLLLITGERLDRYYDYVAGRSRKPYETETEQLWHEAGEEALQLEIGTADAKSTVETKVAQIQDRNKDWVLIGGPPCQAYSLVGRSRNKGKKDYKPEEDHRHFLYRHYLELIRTFRPSVFVMENVKGILSSQVAGRGIFGRILEDLRVDDSSGENPYRIYSLVKAGSVYTGPDGQGVDPHDFIVRSELYGIPQARHRVILLGIREDIAPDQFLPLEQTAAVSLHDALVDLPKLRSGLSANDSVENWQRAVRDQAQRVIVSLRELGSADERKRIRKVLADVARGTLPYTSRGGLRTRPTSREPTEFGHKMTDGELGCVLNHEARGHMDEDLGRYLFAAAYGKVTGVSPSQEHFPASLAPRHRNWFSGSFADRFRVQLAGVPSTTVTSHIAKDGHYYIHPDPKQCRSLTVREAARLQTFPDNYFFEGNRTEQYIQVGNAVPPVLAQQIADRVLALLKK